MTLLAGDGDGPADADLDTKALEPAPSAHPATTRRLSSVAASAVGDPERDWPRMTGP
jgi:hypothetical protein